MGSPLDRAAQVMHVLRSPGGCPWDAAQTHESLTPYLLEETYEVLEAIETADPELLREELGDLLLQVLFHARLATERTDGTAFGIDEVAGDLVDKLVRRHPHVFAAEAGDAVGTVDAETLNESWEQRKIVEKGRTSAVDGVPLAQPALALAAKLTARTRRAGLDVSLPPPGDADARIGRRLLALVQDAVADGVDPEGALRRATAGLRAAILDAEAHRPEAERSEPEQSEAERSEPEQPEAEQSDADRRG